MINMAKKKTKEKPLDVLEDEELPEDLSDEEIEDEISNDGQFLMEFEMESTERTECIGHNRLTMGKFELIRGGLATKYNKGKLTVTRESVNKYREDEIIFFKVKTTKTLKEDSLKIGNFKLKILKGHWGDDEGILDLEFVESDIEGYKMTNNSLIIPLESWDIFPNKSKITYRVYRTHEIYVEDEDQTTLD